MNKWLAQSLERLKEWYDLTFKYPSCWWGIRHIRACFWNIVRIFAYIPVIWGNEDFAYDYILKMLRYKIKRTRDHIARHQIHVGYEKDVANMDVAIEMIDTVLADDYFRDEWNAWHESHPLKILIDEDGEHYTPSMTDEERAEFKPLADKTYAAADQAWHDLWEFLDKHAKEWWD